MQKSSLVDIIARSLQKSCTCSSYDYKMPIVEVLQKVQQFLCEFGGLFQYELPPTCLLLHDLQHNINLMSGYFPNQANYQLKHIVYGNFLRIC